MLSPQCTVVGMCVFVCLHVTLSELAKFDRYTRIYQGVLIYMYLSKSFLLVIFSFSLLILRNK